MSVPLAILGGDVVPIISRILISGLSSGVKVEMGWRFAWKAPRPPAGKGRLEEAPELEPNKPDTVEASPEELPEELPDAEPVVIRPGKREASAGVFFGYASWYSGAGSRGKT